MQLLIKFLHSAADTKSTIPQKGTNQSLNKWEILSLHDPNCGKECETKYHWITSQIVFCDVPTCVLLSVKMVLCNLLSAIMPSGLFSFAWCQMLALLGNYIDVFSTISICKLQLVMRHSAISNLVVCFMSNCILLSLKDH